MWRPDDWSELRDSSVIKTLASVVEREPTFKEWATLIFEAGADAMLGELRGSVPSGSFKHIDKAYKTGGGFYDSPYGCYTCKGRIVFIPDEEESNG